MPKFSGSTQMRPNVHAPVHTTGEQLRTHEGAGAFGRDAESDLFLLAATNMVGEDTFYERAGARDDRFRDLVHVITKTNPGFIAGRDLSKGQIGLAEYLRSSLLMRSASMVMAAEYLAAGGPNARSVIARVLQRPDEPAEMIGYWISRHGRNLPMALKRGVADGARRLYNERSALRYDGGSRSIRMADVIELTHPKARDDRQSALFKYLLDKRHHDSGVAGDQLPMLVEDARLLAVPVEGRRILLREDPERLARAGWSWERLTGWLPGGMDAEAWSFAIPNMGVMALVRNLRNFDQAGLPETLVDAVIERITDPDEVAKARLFPYQVWSAYKNTPSDNWKRALGKTLDLTTANIPSGLDKTLVVVDCSGSMRGPLSARGTIERWEVAAVMAAATVKGTKGSDVVIFGDTNKRLSVIGGTSALQVVERVRTAVANNEVGSSTFGHTAIAEHFDPHKHRRVVLLTDDQMWDSAGGDVYSRRTYGYRGRAAVDISHVPLVYTINLAGYQPSSMEAGDNGRFTLGGFSDATFTAMAVLEAGKNADWPF